MVENWVRWELIMKIAILSRRESQSTSCRRTVRNRRIAIAAILTFLMVGGYSTASAVTVVMFGDSISNSYGSVAPNRMNDFLQTRLRSLFSGSGTTVQVINSGVPGDTLEGGLARLDRDVLAHSPDLVTIEFGLNDQAQSVVYGKTSYTADYFRQLTETAVTTIRQKAPNAKILLLTGTAIDPSRNAFRQYYLNVGYEPDAYYNQFFASKTRLVASNMDVPLCDLFAIFSTAFQSNPSLMISMLLSDGVHLTTQGNDWAASILAPQIHGLLVPEPGVLSQLIPVAVAGILGLLVLFWRHRKHRRQIRQLLGVGPTAIEM